MWNDGEDSTTVFEDRFWAMSPLPYYIKVWPFKSNRVLGDGGRTSAQRIPSGVTLRLVSGGEWTVRMKGKSHSAMPGDIFCAMPSEPIEFSLKEKAPWGWHELQLQGEDAERFLLEFGLSAERPVATPQNPRKARRLFQFMHAQMGSERRSVPKMLSSLFALVDACGASHAQESGKSPEDLVVKAKMIMESAPFVNRNIGEIAEILGVDRSTLYKAFKAKTSISPHEYGDMLRLARAKELLDGTKLDLSQIASQTGFPDVKYFIGWFKAKTSSPPGAWRKSRLESRRERDRKA